MSLRSGAGFCKHCGQRLGEAKPVPWWHVHRRVYDWTIGWAYRPSASYALFGLSFAESSFFPIPPDVLLMPLSLGNPRKWFHYALICTIASVLGALAGYAIGYFAWHAGVDAFFYKYVPGFTPKAYQDIAGLYEQYNFWIVFTAGFTPIPFKLITVTGGAFKISLLPFVVAATISRASRFFLVAGLMRIFGSRITPFIDRYFNLLALLFTALLIGGFVAVKYLAH